MNIQLEEERIINNQSTPFSHSCSSCKVIYITFGLESGLHVSVLVKLNNDMDDLSSESQELVVLCFEDAALLVPCTSVF